MTHAAPKRFDGRTILIAEDTLAIAEVVEHALLDCGCTVIGPFPRLDRLIAAIEGDDFHADAAVLDVDLRGEEVFPAVDLLLARRIPIVLTTGFASAHLPVDYRELPRLEKPVSIDDLLERVAALLTTGTGQSAPA